MIKIKLLICKNCLNRKNTNTIKNLIAQHCGTYLLDAYLSGGWPHPSTIFSATGP